MEYDNNSPLPYTQAHNGGAYSLVYTKTYATAYAEAQIANSSDGAASADSGVYIGLTQNFNFVPVGPPTYTVSGPWSLNISGSISMPTPHEQESNSSAGSDANGNHDSLLTGLPEDPRTSYNSPTNGRYTVHNDNGDRSIASSLFLYVAASVYNIDLGIKGTAESNANLTIGDPDN